jgi:hypothetical protein
VKQVDRKVSIYLGNDEELEDTMKVVDINITKTPNENAKFYYDIRANMIEKEKKTLEATNSVLNQAKDQAEKKLKKKEDTVKAIKVNRKVIWFEKFYWFVSSENYLVISAKDAHQNEIIIKKYLAKDDLVFHTQAPGSAFSLVKNPKGEPVPHQTLLEAATATLCHSKCWDSKIISEVFWVYAEQVSKTAPTGLYVGLGSFMIYGKKNFITPSRLEMGFGLIFRVDEESKKNHVDERKRRDEGNENMMEDPERLLKKAVSVNTNGGQEQANAEEDPEEDGSEDVSEDGKSVAKTMVTNTNRSTIRELEITKDTEVTKVDTTSSSNKTPKQLTKKIKDRQDKKDLKSGKVKEKLPVIEEKPEEKKGAKMTKNKKNRIQKMIDKYGEMDEEEKELQMAMLGAREIKVTKEQKQQLNKQMKETRLEETEETIEEEKEPEGKKNSQKDKKGGKAKEQKKGDSKNEKPKKEEAKVPEKKAEPAKKVEAALVIETHLEEEEVFEDLEDIEDPELGQAEEPRAEEEAQNRQETMSVINTILDEDGERNLNEELEFKDYTGIPKAIGKRV